MGDETAKDALTRRGFLGVSSATLAAASVLGAEKLAAHETAGPKTISDKSRSDPGPTNSVLDAQNPSANHPLPTDAGGVQTFKYPFSFAHKRLQEGGWSREGTQRELAVSKSLAGGDIALAAANSCWYSTMEIFRSTRRCC